MQVRRKELERERAHLFPHIPLVEGILEKALRARDSCEGNSLQNSPSLSV